MNFDELYRTMHEWNSDLDRYRRIEKLSRAFMACETTGDVNLLVNSNIDFLNDNPDCWRMAKNARKRITTIRRERINSWKTQLN